MQVLESMYTYFRNPRRDNSPWVRTAAIAVLRDLVFCLFQALLSDTRRNQAVNRLPLDHTVVDTWAFNPPSTANMQTITGSEEDRGKALRQSPSCLSFRGS